MTSIEREYYFRCQYQAGKLCISTIRTSNQFISAKDMLTCLAELSVKVRNEVDATTGGRVALQVLNIFKDIIKNTDYERFGTGGSVSRYLDPKSKYKENRTERVDVEFFGKGGRDDYSNPQISRFIHLWKKTKFKKSRNRKNKK